METAVEWLVRQLQKEWVFSERDLFLIQQAKEMEIKQADNAYTAGYDNATVEW